MYKKAESDSENFEEFRLLADSLCEFLKDKEWAKKVYMKAEKSAENDEELSDLSGSLIENLGDRKWAKKIIPDNTANTPTLSNNEILMYSKLEPIKIQASYLVWVYDKEIGVFSVNSKKEKHEEVKGYRIWEGKSSIELIWNLPKSKKGALDVLKKKDWRDEDISYDDFEGLENTEGKASTDYDNDGNKLAGVEDFEGIGDTEVIGFESGYGSSFISIFFKSGKEIKLEKSEDNWTTTLPDGESRSVGSYENLMKVINKLLKR